MSMFFLAFLPSVEIVSKIWQRAPDFFFLFFFLGFFSPPFLSFFFSPPLCNFSIQTYLWFGHQQIYILVLNEQLYVTVMSNIRVWEEPQAAGKGERVSLEVILDACQRSFMIRVELLHFLIPTGEVVLVLAFTDEPKQTWALAISAGMLHRFTSVFKFLKTYFLLL